MAVVTGDSCSYQHGQTFKIPPFILDRAYRSNRMIAMTWMSNCLGLGGLQNCHSHPFFILSLAHCSRGLWSWCLLNAKIVPPWIVALLSGPSRDLGPLHKCTKSISSCWRSFHSQQRQWTVGPCCPGFEIPRKSEAKGWIHESLWGSRSSMN